MINLFRVVSRNEWLDFRKDQIFRTTANSLEGKQFFKSRASAIGYAAKATERNFDPPYRFLIHIKVDEDLFNELPHDDQDLDGFAGITVGEDHLETLSIIVTFIDVNDV